MDRNFSLNDAQHSSVQNSFSQDSGFDEENALDISEEIDSAEEIALLKRRLKRSEIAREEAEALLESKSRRLSKLDDQLRQKEEELIRKVDQTQQYLVNAQRLANVATFHIDNEVRFVGSLNFSKIVGSKSEISNIRQLRSMVHQRDIDDIDAIIKNAMSGGLIGNALEHDVRVLDDYGRMRWLRWSAEQIINKDNGRIDCYGAVRDITVERRAERHEKTLLALSERRYKQLQKMSAQLTDRVKAMEMLSNALRDARAVAIRANKSKSRFLAMMSHDIRTPMNAILATLELLGLSELDEVQKRQLKLAQNSGDQLLFLLADIIEYARSDGWLIEIEAQPVAIDSTITNTADTWRQLARKKDLEIETDIEMIGENYIKTDPTRLRQLLDNLISNAIKYTDNGVITISSKIKSEKNEDSLRITVTDTGNGISESVQKMLFEDLERGEHQDDLNIQGSGLGLSICRRIVYAMNGDIGVESKLNQGSMFWFEIPVKVMSEDDYVYMQDDEKIIQTLSVNDQRPKLLVAEDVAANRMVLTSMLEKLGCDYEVAMDGRQAVEITQLHKFDAILMDVSMPRMNGMEATKEIRSQGKKTPIIAVTAFAADDEKEAIMAAGMDGLISKPISISSLHQSLEKIFCAKEDNDLHRYLGHDKDRNRASVPDFDVVDYIDTDKLRHQIISVPPEMRIKLQDAIVDDLGSWFRRFQTAWRESDSQEISATSHALKGICNGFGAHKLIASIENLRSQSEMGDIKALSQVIDIYDHTTASFKNAADIMDRRSS